MRIPPRVCPQVDLGPGQPGLDGALGDPQEPGGFPGGQAVQHDGLDNGAHLRRQCGQGPADVAVLDREQHLLLGTGDGRTRRRRAEDNVAVAAQPADQAPDGDTPQPGCDLTVAPKAPAAARRRRTCPGGRPRPAPGCCSAGPGGPTTTARDGGRAPGSHRDPGCRRPPAAPCRSGSRPYPHCRPHGPEKIHLRGPIFRPKVGAQAWVSGPAPCAGWRRTRPAGPCRRTRRPGTRRGHRGNWSARCPAARPRPGPRARPAAGRNRCRRR